jgi:hypothetical protein
MPEAVKDSGCTANAVLDDSWLTQSVRGCFDFQGSLECHLLTGSLSLYSPSTPFMHFDEKDTMLADDKT